MKSIISILTLLVVLIPLNSAFSQPGNLHSAKNSIPVGDAGVDFNLVDSEGEKEGLWIRVWPSGSLYYKGSFDSGKPTGEFLYFYDSGELMSVLNHVSENISAIHYRSNGSVQASGFYNHLSLIHI